MPSFDVVSEIDVQEVDNAVNQASKEIGTRFDFRGGNSSVEFDRVAKKIKIVADDELKLRAIQQILEQKMARRNLDIRCLNYSKEEIGNKNSLKQTAEIKSGIDKETAKKITKTIKDSGLKVQAQIQDEQVRVTGKKIDDLQEVIALLRNNNFSMPLQFINMRS